MQWQLTSVDDDAARQAKRHATGLKKSVSAVLKAVVDEMMQAW